MFDIRNCYWIVAGSTTQVWSSQRVGYSSTSDATYQAWLAAGNAPTKIASAAELLEVLQDQWAPLILSQGCTLTSTGTPALNGTYALDKDSQNNISAIADGIANGKGLPGGGSTFNYPDVTGAEHAFDSSHFTAAAAAFETFIYDFDQALETLVSGGTATMPTASVTIAYGRRGGAWRITSRSTSLPSTRRRRARLPTGRCGCTTACRRARPRHEFPGADPRRSRHRQGRPPHSGMRRGLPRDTHRGAGARRRNAGGGASRGARRGGTAEGPVMDRFEYMSRPLTTETTPADLDELGADGWELCGVSGGIGWFKRSRTARALQEQGERHAAERLDRPPAI